MYNKLQITQIEKLVEGNSVFCKKVKLIVSLIAAESYTSYDKIVGGGGGGGGAEDEYHNKMSSIMRKPVFGDVLPVIGQTSLLSYTNLARDL